jgi:hypothetical protein
MGCAVVGCGVAVIAVVYAVGAPSVGRLHTSYLHCCHGIMLLMLLLLLLLLKAGVPVIHAWVCSHHKQL